MYKRSAALEGGRMKDEMDDNVLKRVETWICQLPLRDYL